METPTPISKTIDLRKLFKFELKFYKELAQISKCTKLFLNIPEMLISGFGLKSPTLICTDYRTGEVLIKENLSKQAISESFALFASVSNHSEGMPIAVCKTQQNSSYRDKTKLLFSAAECEYAWDYNNSQQKGQVIQKFIRNPLTTIYKSEYSITSKIKTYMMRKKNERSLSHSVIMKKNVERMKYLVVNNDSCSRYPVSVPTIDNKMMYLVYLIEKYYIKEYSIKLMQLKCNWIEDQSGKYYFLNLKEYKITSSYERKETIPTVTPSTSLPSISFIKKIREIQERSRNSIIKIKPNIWMTFNE